MSKNLSGKKEQEKEKIPLSSESFPSGPGPLTDTGLGADKAVCGVGTQGHSGGGSVRRGPRPAAPGGDVSRITAWASAGAAVKYVQLLTYRLLLKDTKQNIRIN